MKVYIFTGPTLRAEEGRAELDAVFLPPALQGDVYRAALERPAAIGLIDGCFERAPAVWHKEILWAMSEGIHVYGSASMGALRAAELAPFGMEGVGTIFEAFQRGEWEDDDEVAVSHAGAEDGFRPLSEAMVNLRATLASAERAGVVGARERARLERLAKEMDYPERSYPALLARASREGLPASMLEALRAWLPKGQVNQKRADALSMLRRMREHLASRPGPKQVSYTFAHTDAWEEARRRCERLRLEAGAALPRDSLMEELRVSGLFPRVHHGALARALALEEAQRQGLEPDAAALQEACDALRAEHGLLEVDPFLRWLREQRIEDPARFLREEAQVRWVETVLEPEVERCLPEHLRSTGEYGSLLERTRRKAHALAKAGLQRPGLAEAGLTEEALWCWYFTERLGVPVPTALDPCARRLGFEDVDALRRAALREFCFLRLESAR
ncbi:TfuA-like protein [Archangium sp.]|uniref:TfuA-like protein n=1 Tax=Archangium sp. TaxID=1872627 RepID=UPI002D2DB895|nr:TfuA-like protein [Archangium sp.]HYO54549.1 TfuA-like protein [Archangium sp.]